MNDDRLAELMVKVTDDLATPAEREELMAFIADKPDLQQELDMHRGLKATTDGWVERLEADLAEDRWRTSGLTQIWTWVGVTLVVTGIAILMAGGLVELVLDPEVPGWLKVGYTAMSGGFVVLLAAVARWRWTTMHSDKYTEVIR